MTDALPPYPPPAVSLARALHARAASDAIDAWLAAVRPELAPGDGCWARAAMAYADSLRSREAPWMQ